MKNLILILAVIIITGCGANAQDATQPEHEQLALRSFGEPMTMFIYNDTDMVIISYDTVREYGIDVLRMNAECLACDDIKPMYFYYDHLPELYEQNEGRLPGMIGTAQYSDGVFLCESIETGATRFVELGL